jgi:NAD(P)-dependent dehydrogenase (short-subunit alcohol dehydrogenase family)
MWIFRDSCAHQYHAEIVSQDKEAEMNRTPKRFENKVALITGGASGIGLAAAERLASEGALLAIVDRDGRHAREVAERIVASGGRAISLQADVRNQQLLETAFNAAAAEFGRLDVVVNSAGVIARGRLETTTDEDWRNVLEINLFSMFYSARAALPLLRKGGGGAIVNIASVVGSVGAINAAYSASKGGVVAITRQLADELAKDRIRVNSVSPGFTSTPLNKSLRDAGAESLWANQIPLGRYGLPAEIAAACAFLASDDATYITGIDLVVDGGLSAVARPELAPTAQNCPF